MDKYYERIILKPLDIKFEGSLLNGSNTNKAIKVDQVTVEDYTNGFDSSIAPDGFQDITFD